VQILESIDNPSGGIGKTVGGQFMSEGGFLAGKHGNQMSVSSPAMVTVFDDFVGASLATTKWTQVETDTDGAGAHLAGGIGGVLRITSGNDDGNAVVLPDLSGITGGLLQWQASNGGLAMQARIKVSRVTLAYIFVGFTDLATVEAPVIASQTADGITTNASDAVGFMFDTGSASDTWFLVGVAGDTDATKQVLTDAPVAGEYATLRVEVSSAGVATFFINGLQVGDAMSGAVTAATDLTPCVYVSNTDGTSAVTLDVDYVYVQMNRAADGGAV